MTDQYDSKQIQKYELKTNMFGIVHLHVLMTIGFDQFKMEIWNSGFQIGQWKGMTYSKRVFVFVLVVFIYLFIVLT